MTSDDRYPEGFTTLKRVSILLSGVRPPVMFQNAIIGDSHRAWGVGAACTLKSVAPQDRNDRKPAFHLIMNGTVQSNHQGMWDNSRRANQDAHFLAHCLSNQSEDVQPSLLMTGDRASLGGWTARMHELSKPAS